MLKRISPGDVFGCLTVIKMEEERDRSKKIRWLCQCSCGKTSLFTKGYLQKGIHKHCKYCLADNLVEQKFGKINVLKRYENKIHGGQIAWYCKCDCGEDLIVPTFLLKQNRKTQCNKCSSTERRKGHEEILRIVWNNIVHGARARNLDLDISIEFINSLLLDQNRKCALSGLDINPGSSCKDIKDGNRTASLDRIDSKKGYYEDNVQWVHTKINYMKQDLSEDEFLQLCKIIYLYNKEKGRID